MTDGPKGARGRRFEGALDPRAAELNASISFDHRLLRFDVEGSIAHAMMLGARGVIAKSDVDKIIHGIRSVEERLRNGVLTWDEALEDVHMNVEARLIEEIGDAGRRLHTGRSRNDQVATDLRLYTRDAAKRLVELLHDCRRALVRQARQHVGTVMPGYTHLQRAQPVRLAHHLLAYETMFARDARRFAFAEELPSPLGAGALAATTVPIDREAVAVALGFVGTTRNSLDAVGDRDFAIDMANACAIAQLHLSRLGEELVLWTSQEFSFVTLGEAYCSGSSLMPQKMNPDIAELLRAKVGRTIGAWVTLATVVKGLPLAYNKDLQETQEPLYEVVETLGISLEVARGMIDSLKFDVARMREAVGAGYLLATELAEYLVTKQVPFREAHDVAGAIVRMAIGKGVELSQLSVEELREHHKAFDADIADWLDVEKSIDRRDVPGGPAAKRVLEELARVEQSLGML